MDSLFLEIIQVSIGRRITLSCVPSESDWKLIYHHAKKQAIIGVCFVGIQNLYANSPRQVCNLPDNLKRHWMTLAFKIQKQNITLNQQCKFIQAKFLDDGFDTCVLKGQGVASYYNSDLKLYRQSGDIDVWVNATCDEVMSYVNSISPNREFDMKHTHLEILSNTVVEVHWWPSMPVNPLYKKSLQVYYTEQVQRQCQHKVRLDENVEITAPDTQFEIIHVMYHIFNHFLYEGIGLRQLMDLYFVLVNGELEDNAKYKILNTLKKIGLASFAPAVMWVLCHVFNMPLACSIGSVDERSGKLLLKEIYDGGNFGFHSKENRVINESFFHRMLRRMKRRIRLVRYNFWGVIMRPFVKLKTLIWKRRMIKRYNL